MDRNERAWTAAEDIILLAGWMDKRPLKAIANELSRSYPSVRGRVRTLKKAGTIEKRGRIKCEKTDRKPGGGSENHEELIVQDDEIKWKFSENKPLSIDEIFERFKLKETKSINIDDYEVAFFKVESWDVTAWKSGKAEKVRNYLTDVRFRKKKKEAMDWAAEKESLIRLCSSFAPDIPPVKYGKCKDAVMMELGIYDPHYGKLSIIDKTSERATLEGASTMVRNAIVDLIEKVQHYRIEKILFPIGNDWSHINNSEGTTLKGTPLEFTDYLFQIRRVCKEDLVWAVKYMLQVAPVEILQVPGNHDEDVILTIAEILEAYFHNNKHVKVDISPQLRKSMLYGNNFIGFTHGDPKDVKVERLPLIFAAEEKQKWVAAEYHELHLGHIHFAKEQTFILGDEFNGVRIRWIPSLASADSWHYRHGFVKSRKAAEVFIWDKETGFDGYFSTNVRMH